MKTQYTYRPDRQITAMCLDETLDKLWLAFKLKNGVCPLHRQEPSDPDVSVGVDLSLEVDEITALYISGDYLYAGVEDDTYLAKQITTATPETSTWITLPAGIVDKVADIVADTNNIYFLIAGSPTAVVIIQKSDLSLVDTVILSESGNLVENAKKIDIDYYGNIWITSDLDTASPKLIKLFLTTGLTYSYTIFDVI